jgi:hypothetical protein
MRANSTGPHDQTRFQPSDCPGANPRAQMRPASRVELRSGGWFVTERKKTALPSGRPCADGMSDSPLGRELPLEAPASHFQHVPSLPCPRLGFAGLLYGSVTLVILLAVWYFGFRAPPPAASSRSSWGSRGTQAMPVKVVVAQRQPLSVHLKSIGTVVPLNTVTVRSRVEGQAVARARSRRVSGCKRVSSWPKSIRAPTRSASPGRGTAASEPRPGPDGPQRFATV